ncbi:MAG: murein hydrolase activator EnvC family protein, partial [Acidimicrobiia bacterium]
ASPAAAVTPAEIEKAKRERAELQRRLDKAVVEYEGAERRLTQTQGALAQTQLKLVDAEKRLQSAQAALSQRANLTYRNGPAGLVHILLSSSALSDFIRRLAILERAASSDSAVLLKATRARAEIAELRADLAAKKAEQQSALSRLESISANLSEDFEKAKALEAKLIADRAEQLRRKREAERRAAAAAAAARRSSRSFSPGKFVCPVDGPSSFRDSWGESRSGGRRHQGVDIFAAYGTPTAAVVDGVILRMSSSSLGGLTLYLRGSDGSEYFYAHLARYAEVSVGQHVPAGTHVAYVGNSGNARGTAPHLHFEIHPGGGGAINPYPTVKAACG